MPRFKLTLTPLRLTTPSSPTSKRPVLTTLVAEIKSSGNPVEKRRKLEKPKPFDPRLGKLLVAEPAEIEPGVALTKFAAMCREPACEGLVSNSKPVLHSIVPRLV